MDLVNGLARKDFADAGVMMMQMLETKKSSWRFLFFEVYKHYIWMRTFMKILVMMMIMMVMMMMMMTSS